MVVTVSQGVVFIQMTPLGFVATVTLVAMFGALVDRASRLAVSKLADS